MTSMLVTLTLKALVVCVQFIHFVCIDLMISPNFLIMVQMFQCVINFFSGPVDAGNYCVLVFGYNTNIKNSFIPPKNINAHVKMKRNNKTYIRKKKKLDISI